MEATSRSQVRRRPTRIPRVRRAFTVLFEWWWNIDRRRHIARLDDQDRHHPLDEAHVIAAMSRQLEEIRRLPEVAA